MNDEAEAMKLQQLDSLCDYDALSKMLQILIKPRGRVVGSIGKFCFSSSNIHLAPIAHTNLAGWRDPLPYLTFIERLVFSNMSDLAEFTNAGADVGCVGFSAENAGTIHVHSFELPPAANGLFVLRAAFLCCSGHCNVASSLFPVIGDPLQMLLHHNQFPHHATYFCSSPVAPAAPAGLPTLVFFQSGERVLEKPLAAGESFVVSLGCLVAFTDQVSIQLQPLAAGGLFQQSSHLGTHLRITGPGRIFLSGSGSPEGISGRGRGGAGDAGLRRHPGGHNLAAGLARMLVVSFCMALVALLCVEIRAELRADGGAIGV